jgi:hypothetical protein
MRAVSKWNLDPEVVYLSGGSIEVHEMHRTPVHLTDDGLVQMGDPLHVQANVRVFLHGEEGFFAFSLSPAEASALAASVDRHCPDAEPEDVITGAVLRPSRVRRPSGNCVQDPGQGSDLS